jgi:hypothetical protein
MSNSDICTKCKKRPRKKDAIVCQECLDLVQKKKRRESLPITSVSPDAMAQHGQGNTSGFVQGD